MARAEERLRGDKNTFRKLSSSLNIFNKLMAKVPFASRRSSIGEGLEITAAAAAAAAAAAIPV